MSPLALESRPKATSAHGQQLADLAPAAQSPIRHAPGRVPSPPTAEGSPPLPACRLGGPFVTRPRRYGKGRDRTPKGTPSPCRGSHGASPARTLAAQPYRSHTRRTCIEQARREIDPDPRTAAGRQRGRQQARQPVGRLNRSGPRPPAATGAQDAPERRRTAASPQRGGKRPRPARGREDAPRRAPTGPPGAGHGSLSVPPSLSLRLPPRAGCQLCL